jgi:putative membrane-bound dehydrogenase-like protein
MTFSPKLALPLVLAGTIAVAAEVKPKPEYKPLEDARRPVATTEALAPAEAVKHMAVPPGFTVQVVAGEPEVVQPVAYTIDDRGRLWVIQNTNYPACPGEPKDSILIFEDTDGDGKADKRTVFYDKLTFATGINVGFGGVWLGAPPNLLFFPDKNGDDQPDSEPEKVLDGWGNEDTHETMNDFTWGPDGWLYGTQGVYTNSNVGAPGTPEKDRTPINAGVWRYHPTKKKFEVYAEGASNQWGVDWNDWGQGFFEACVIPHMWQCIQGGRYHRQSGQHFNKFTYDDLKPIAAFEYEKRAYCGAMVYLGGQWPEEFRNTFFFHDIHMNKLRNEKLERKGSGYQAVRNIDFLASEDKWYRGLSPQYGPDGSVFVNDWYDKVPCHQQREFTDRSNGRLYKIVYQGAKPVSVDLQKATDAELVQYQLNSNEWFVRHARRILQERGPKPEVQAALEKMLAENPDDTRQLRALWTLHATQSLTEPTALQSLTAKSEWVRAWTIQLMTEDRSPSEALLAKFAELAKSDPSPVVRLYLASAAGRIEIPKRWPILTALAAHAEDADDHNLPLLLWYAVEPAVGADVAKAAELLTSCQIPKVQEFITRRMATVATLETK